MNLFTTICAWLAVIAAVVAFVSLIILIWMMPVLLVGKIALTATAIELFGAMGAASSIR